MPIVVTKLEQIPPTPLRTSMGQIRDQLIGSHAIEDLKDEVETVITPEMIAAGCHAAANHSHYLSPPELKVFVVEIYLTMEAIRQSLPMD